MPRGALLHPLLHENISTFSANAFDPGSSATNFS